MNELKLQARIVKDCNGWARKVGNLHQAGTPDLFVKQKNTSPVFIECKKDKLNLSPIQRETLRRMHIAGIYCGWLVHCQENRIHNMFVGADPDAITPVANENCDMITLTGKKWDVSRIVDPIVYWSRNEIQKA